MKARLNDYERDLLHKDAEFHGADNCKVSFTDDRIVTVFQFKGSRLLREAEFYIDDRPRAREYFIGERTRLCFVCSVSA